MLKYTVAETHTNRCRATCDFKVISATACFCLTLFSPGKLAFYGRVLKSVACAAHSHKAADEIVGIFFVFLRNEINELIVT
jgi:hypothetical protein